MEMHAFILSILLLTILSGSDARSVDQVCSEKCTGGIRQFFAKDDYEYSYSYVTTVESSFHTGSYRDQKAELSIQVPFSIITSTDCNLVLQTKKGIYIDNREPETDEELAWQEAITAYPLHFSWQNGVVESVCPATNDPAWVVNFKRGILSALQASKMTSSSAVKELDVSGDCEADYSVETDGVTIIRKTKDYTKCTNRNKHLLFSWSLPYDISSPRQNYIHSKQSCVYYVADVMRSLICTEEHVFRPFSTDEAGARTNIEQRIFFLSQRRLRSVPYSRVTIRHSDLAFEEESEMKNTNMEEKTRAAKDLLTEICATMDGENYQNVGKEFISLVHAIRELDAEALTELNRHADTCSDWRSALKQMLSNTLPFCGTESCVTFATSLMNDNSLEKLVAERWLTGFGLIKKPTEGMISSIMDVVESGRYPEQSFLATGSMIHQFCQNSDGNCMNNRVIRNSIEVLMQHLGTNCRSPNSESRKMTLLALRAIGNAGQTSSSATLKRCIEETGNPMEIRVAAADAYRRMSCGTDRSALLGRLQDRDEDSEMRIVSYANLMMCPTAELVTTVKNILETEENMQVGSYIWSHVTQVMESQDPLKHFFQVLLQGHTFKDFSLDPRKYSRYYEASLFSERVNSGGTAEASLIWSPKSFIPRGASVNLTLDLFGQAVNLFEFGGRVEGVESLLQSILEPKAYAKRIARNDMQPFGSERRRNSDGVTTSDKVQASWFMRVFGNELIYGNTDMMKPIEAETSDIFSNVIAKFMSEDGYNYHDDALILNSIHTLPTGNGLLLQVAFNGSTTVDVNAAGRFSMGFGSSTEFLVRGKVTPRAALVVTGSMSIDARVRRTGIATESTAYSSTSVNGYVKISDGGKAFDVEIDSPYSRNMAFDFNHKLLKIEGHSLVEVGDKPPASTLLEGTTCSDEFLGQRLCFNKIDHNSGFVTHETASYVFPTNGGLSISAYMEKTDQGLTKYTASGNIRTLYENDDDTVPQNLLLRLNFDTPGSHVNRKTTTFFSYSLPEKQINIRAQQGEATLLQLQGEYHSSDGLNGVSVSAEYKEQIYRFAANTRRTFEENRKQLATDVTIELPSKTMTINGMMDYNAGKRFQGSFEMNNILPTPVVMKIDLQDNSESQDMLVFNGNGKVTILPFINSEFIMDMDMTPRLDNLVFNLNYKIGGSPKQTVLFHHKRTNLGRSGETDWTISQMFTASQFTALNHKLSVSHKYSKGMTASNLDIGYGPRMEELDNDYKLELRQEYSDTSDASATRVNGLWSINFPLGGVNRELRFSHQRDADVISTNIDNIVAGTPYHFTFLWKNNVPGSNRLNENLEVALYPTEVGHWRFVNTLEEVVENVYKVSSKLSLGDLEQLIYQQESTVTNKADNKSIEFFLTKGGDPSGIMRASSVNYVSGGSKYISKNMMHVIGYDQRGLNFVHDELPMEGFKTSLDFIKGSSIVVGLDLTSKPTENGRHYSFGSRQYQVNERVTMVKFGYEYIPERLFDTYTTLTDHDETRFALRTTTHRSSVDSWSGNFMVAAKGHPSLPFSRNIDTNTTVSYTVGKTVQVDLSSRFQDKNLHFTAIPADNGLHGILQQNYHDFLSDISYNIARTSDGVNAMISSGGRQAHARASVNANIVEMSFDHESIPDLMELNVPTEIGAMLRKNPENTPTNLQATVTVDRVTAFDITYSWRRPESPTNRFAMSNDLFAVLPTSANWEITSTAQQLEITIGLNSEDMRISMINNFPESGAIKISHSFELIENYIPNDFTLSYDGQIQPGLTHFNMVVGDKVVTFDANMYSSSHFKVDLATQGIILLPRRAMIELEGEFSRERIDLNGNAQYNEETYGVSIETSANYQPGTTFLPYTEVVGSSQFSIKITRGNEVKWSHVGSSTIAKDRYDQSYELHQTLTDHLPASLVEEQHMIMSDNEFSLFRKKTENGVKVSHYELHYVPGAVRFTQTYWPMLPEVTAVTFDVDMESGTITLQTEMEETQTASLSYSIHGTNGFDIQATHDFDMVSLVIPSPVRFTGSLPSDGNSVESTYQWGTKEGSMRLWKNSLMNMGLVSNSNDCSFNFTYNIKPYDIAVSGQARFMGHLYSSNFNGGFKLDETSTMLKNVHGDLSIHTDQKYFISTNFYEIRGNSLFVNMTDKQTITDKLPASYNFTRTFTFGTTSNSISFEVDGTLQDPFYLSGKLSYDDHTSVTAEMHHKQDGWKTIPKTLIAKLEKSQNDQTYEAKASVTMDKTTTAATATLSYTMDETSGSINAVFTNEFTALPYLPQKASLVTSGSMANSQIAYKITGTWDDKIFNETGKVNYAEAPTLFSFEVYQNQNGLVALPAKSSIVLTKTTSAIELIVTYNAKKLTFRIDLSNAGLSVSAAEQEGTEITPYNLGVRWSKQPVSMELTHDLSMLSPIPRNLAVQANTDDGNLLVTIGADDGTSAFSVRKVAEGDNVRFLLEHDLDILSPIPRNAEVTYQKSPQKVVLVWEENEVSLEANDSGFAFKQNVLESLPKVISLSTNFNFNAPVKMVELNGAIDEYAALYKMTLQTTETYATTLVCKITKAEESLMNLEVDMEIGATEGSEKVTFSQSLSESVGSSYSHSVEYNLGKSAGMVSFEVGAEDPVRVKVTYSDVEGMSLRYRLVHNVGSISEILPYETTGEGSVEWSDTRKNIHATVLSKQITLGLVTDVEREEKSIVASIEHNFDVIENSLYIPKSAQLDLHSSPNNYEATVSYTFDSNEKHVKLQTTIEESEIQLTLDQNIIEPAPTAYTRRRTQFQYPQKASLRLIKDAATYKAMLSFKTGQKRRYFNIEYTFTASQSGSNTKVKILQNLNRMVRKSIPNDMEMSVTMNETATTINVQWDENNVDLIGSLDISENFKAMIASTHRAPDLTQLGVPSDISMSIATQPHMVFAVNYGQDYAGRLTVKQPVIGTENAITVYAKVEEIEITASSSLSLMDRELNFKVVGTQTGLDETLPRNFQFTTDASYDSEARSAEFTSSHNVDQLRLLYPKSLTATLSVPQIRENTLEGGYTFNADGMKSENSIRLTWTKTLHGYEITSSGVRTDNFFSRSPSDRLSYNGKMSAESDYESEQKSLKWVYEYSETNDYSETVLQHSAHVMGAMNGQTVTWELAASLPPYLNEALTNTGSLTYGSDIEFNNAYKRGDYHVSVTLSADVEQNFNFGIVGTYGELSLVFNKNLPHQFTFTHNIELFSVIPSAIILAYDANARTASIQVQGRFDGVYFDGKLATEMNSEQKSFRWTYELTGTSGDAEVILRHSAHVIGRLTGKTVTWDIAATLPPYLEEGFTNTGSLNFASDFAFSNEYRRDDYHVVTRVSGTMGQNFNLDISNKYGELSFIFDKTKTEQIVFTHDIEMMSVIPTSVTVAINSDAKTAMIRAGFSDADLLVTIEQYLFKTTYTTESNGEVVNIHGQYSSHPTQKVAGTIKIVPLNLDYSATLDMQFFRPRDGKSFVNLALLENTSRRGITSSVYALLQNSDIRDIKTGASFVSNFTSAPLNFMVGFALGHEPFSYDLTTEMGRYSIKVNGTRRGYTFLMNLPRYYKIHELLIENTYDLTDSSSNALMIVQWNGGKKIGYKTSAENVESIWGHYEIYQPFVEPMEITAGYRYEQRNGWHVVNTTITDNGRPFTVITKYKEYARKQTTRKLVMDVRQSYAQIIPQRFITTGIVTIGENLVDNDWKLSAGGEDMFTVKKHIEVTSEEGNIQVGWTHPFKDIPLSSFDSSLNWQLGSDSLTVLSEISHSEDSQNFPKHFTVTGKYTLNDLLFENDWKVSGNGEDFIVWYEKIEMRESGYGTQLTWKHPFEHLPLAHYDGTLDVEYEESTVNVNSEITHSGDNTYIPSNFVTTGRMTVGDLLYDSDWKIVSEGQELVVLKKLFRELPNGYKVVVNWKQPYEEFGLTSFDLDSTLTLQSNTMDLNVDISHSFDHSEIPKHFVTTGVVTVGDKLYDSDWKITSGGENLVVLKKLFKASESGLNMELHWQQPFDSFPLKTLDSNVILTKESSSSKFSASLQYNDAHEYTADYSSIASNSYSRNYTVGFTADGQRHESKFYLASQRWRSSGNQMTLVYDNTVPQESVLAKYVPTRQHFDLTTYRKGINTKFTTVYSSSLLPYPLKVEGSVLMSEGNTMFDTSLAFKNSAETTAAMDLEVKLNVDRVTGVTIECKIPSLGLDRSLNLKYDQQSQQATISYMNSGEEPIVVTINLSEFIPRMRQIIKQLQQKNVIPELKIVGDVSHGGETFDAYVGLKVRETTYTIHLSSGYANEQGFLNVTTKRNFMNLDTILSVTAKLLNSETAQIQIQTSKKLGRFLSYALSSSSAELKDKIVVITDALTKALQSFEGIVQGSGRIQGAVEENRAMLLSRVSQVKAKSLEFLDNTNNGVLDSVTNGQEEINSGLWKAITALSAGVDKLLEIVKRPLEELKQDYLSSVSTQVFNSVQPVLQPVVNGLNTFHAGQLFLELVQEGITKFVFTMEKNAEALLTAAREPLAKLVLVSEDKVIINIPLHVPVKGLIAPPSMGDIGMWIAESSLSHEVKAKLEILYQAIDLFNKYRSVLNMPLDEIVPPFKGHAEISGFRHVRTFDGKRYDYKSACESKHVLARDVRDNEFTVIVHYGSSPSIEIITLDSRGGEEIIVLRPDYSVTDERGRDIVVPNEYEDVLVKRIGEIVTVQTTYGLVVSCNFVSDICTIDVSPFYFARLGGMLGTFNNEPSDDYMGQAMVTVSDSEELALSWMQPGSCSGNNEEQRCTVRSSEKCTALFEGRDSTFASCFPVEDPTPYMQMCLKDSCSDNGICSAVASYARRCALRGVILSTPASCMNCVAVGGSTFGSTRQVEVRGADVVFVVERSGCMRFRKKDYKKLVGELHDTLNATIATGNINYAVVGFGGPDNLAEPHTVTFGNEIFIHPASYDLASAEEKTIINALKRGEKSQEVEPDILQALVYASQLPFRAGAARTIILMTCNDCSGNSEVHTGYVRGLLQDQGIVIHHLRQQSIQAGRSAKKVYGFNTQEIFSKTSTSNLPRSELKASSNDQCLPLADVTGGSVWNANLFGKDALPLIVGEISTGISETSTQECVCGTSEYGTTIAKCTSPLGRR